MSFFLIQDPIGLDTLDIGRINMTFRIIVILLHGLFKVVAIYIRTCATRYLNDFFIISFFFDLNGLLLNHLYCLKWTFLEVMREVVVTYQVFKDIFNQPNCCKIYFVHELEDQVHHHVVISFKGKM